MASRQPLSGIQSAARCLLRLHWRRATDEAPNLLATGSRHDGRFQMQIAEQIDFAALMEPVARRLLGEPNTALSSAKELRYGTRGSLAISLEKGTWFDHELSEGGGTIDLIKRQQNCEHASAVTWLRREFLNGNQGREKHQTNGT